MGFLTLILGGGTLTSKLIRFGIFVFAILAVLAGAAAAGYWRCYTTEVEPLKVKLKEIEDKQKEQAEGVSKDSAVGQQHLEATVRNLGTQLSTIRAEYQAARKQGRVYADRAALCAKQAADAASSAQYQVLSTPGLIRLQKAVNAANTTKETP